MIRFRRVVGVMIAAELFRTAAAFTQDPAALPTPTPIESVALPPAAMPVCVSPGPGGIRPFLRDIWQPPPPAPPAGYYVSQWYTAQIAKADLQKQFILPHEWYQGGSTLGPSGRRHLDRLARSLLDAPGVVYLEPAESAKPAEAAKLDQTRQAFLITELSRYGVKDAERRVVLAYPLGEGLFAEDALLTYRRLFITRGSGGGGFGAGGGLGALGGFGTFGGMSGLGGMGGFGTGFGGFRGY